MHKIAVIIVGCLAVLSLSCGTFSGMSAGTGVRTGNAEQTENPMIICLGDDLTVGLGAAGMYEEDPTRAFPAIIQKHCSIPVVNAGNSGETTTLALLRLYNDVLAYNPSVVIINLGLIDLFEGVEIWLTDYNFRIMLSLTENGKRKVFLTRTFPENILREILNDFEDWSDDEKEDYIAQYNDMFNSYADEYSVEIIDVWRGVWGRHMSSDVHPDAAGYEIMGNNYLEALKPYLQSRNYYKP